MEREDERETQRAVLVLREALETQPHNRISALLDKAIAVLESSARRQDVASINRMWEALDNALVHPEPVVRSAVLHKIVEAVRTAPGSLALCKEGFVAIFVAELVDCVHGDELQNNRLMAMHALGLVGVVLASDAPGGRGRGRGRGRTLTWTVCHSMLALITSNFNAWFSQPEGSPGAMQRFCVENDPDHRLLVLTFHSLTSLTRGRAAKSEAPVRDVLIFVCAELLRAHEPHVSAVMALQILQLIEVVLEADLDGLDESGDVALPDTCLAYCALLTPVIEAILERYGNSKHVQQLTLGFLARWATVFMSMDDLELRTRTLGLRHSALTHLTEFLMPADKPFPQRASMLREVQSELRACRHDLRERVDTIRTVLHPPGTELVLGASATTPPDISHYTLFEHAPSEEPAVRGVEAFKLMVPASREAVVRLALVPPSLPEVPADCVTAPPLLIPSAMLESRVAVTPRMIAEVPDIAPLLELGYTIVPPPAQSAEEEFASISADFGSFGAPDDFGGCESKYALGPSDSRVPVLSKREALRKEGALFGKRGHASATREPPCGCFGLLDSHEVPDGFLPRPLTAYSDMTKDEKDELNARLSRGVVGLETMVPAPESQLGGVYRSGPQETGSMDEPDFAETCVPVLSAYHTQSKRHFGHKAPVPQQDGKPEPGAGTPLMRLGVVEIWVQETYDKPIRRYTLQVQALLHLSAAERTAALPASTWAEGSSVEAIVGIRVGRSGPLQEYKAILTVVSLQQDEEGLSVWRSSLGGAGFPDPYPAAQTSSGRPVFAPPANFSPMPATYDRTTAAPLYAPATRIAMLPVAFLENGLPLFSRQEPVPPNVQPIAYMNSGLPLFPCPGALLPKPVGYTSMGVPFYSSLAVALHPLYNNTLVRRITVRQRIRATMRRLKARAQGIMKQIKFSKGARKKSSLRPGASPILSDIGTGDLAQGTPQGEEPESGGLEAPADAGTEADAADSQRINPADSRAEPKPDDDCDPAAQRSSPAEAPSQADKPEGTREQLELEQAQVSNVVAAATAQEEESKLDFLGEFDDEFLADLEPLNHPDSESDLSDSESSDSEADASASEQEASKDVDPFLLGAIARNLRRQKTERATEGGAGVAAYSPGSGLTEEIDVKVAFNPATIKFDHASSEELRMVTLRVRSGLDKPGSVFVVAEPPEVFEVSPSLLSLAPDTKLRELQVKFKPLEYPFESSVVEGSLSVQTFTGKTLSVCDLVGFRGPVVRVMTTTEMQVWAEPGARAVMKVRVSNLRDTKLEFSLHIRDESAERTAGESEGDEDGEDDEDLDEFDVPVCPFTLAQRKLSLDAREDSDLVVYFTPGDRHGLHTATLVVESGTREQECFPLEAHCGTALIVRKLNRQESQRVDAAVATGQEDVNSSVTGRQSGQAESRRSSILASMKLKRRPTMTDAMDEMKVADKANDGASRWKRTRRLLRGLNVMRGSKFSAGQRASLQIYSRGERPPSARQSLIEDSLKVSAHRMVKKTDLAPADPSLALEALPTKAPVVPLLQNGTQQSSELDFGLVDPGQPVVRHFAVDNLRDSEIVIGMHCDMPDLFRLPSFDIVPAKTSKMFQIRLLGQPGLVGPIETTLFIYSPSLHQPQVVTLKAYLGRALEIPVGRSVYFAPTEVGRTRRIRVPVLNHSQYEVHFALLPFAHHHEAFSSSIGSDVSAPAKIGPFGTLYLELAFSPGPQRGVYYSTLALQCIRPTLHTYEASGAVGVVELLGFGFRPLSAKETGALLDPNVGTGFDLNRLNDIQGWIRDRAPFPGHAGRASELEDRPESKAQIELLDQPVDESSEPSAYEDSLLWRIKAPDGSVRELRDAESPEAAVVETGVEVDVLFVNGSRNFHESAQVFCPASVDVKVSNDAQAGHGGDETAAQATIGKLVPGMATAVKFCLDGSFVRPSPPFEFSFVAAACIDEGQLTGMACLPLVGTSPPWLHVLPLRNRKPALNFPRCCVGNAVSLRLVLRNTSHEAGHWKVAYPEAESYGFRPFVVSSGHEEGSLEPFESTTLRITFAPQAECIYRDSMLLTLSQDVAVRVAGQLPEDNPAVAPGDAPNEESKAEDARPSMVRQAVFEVTVALSGVGYQVNLEGLPSDEDSVLRFGNAVVGQTMTHILYLSNEGKIEEEIFFRTEAPFESNPTHVLLRPNEQVDVSISFTPTKPGHAHAKLSVLYGGKSQTSQLIGYAGTLAPLSTCKDNVLDFGKPLIGMTTRDNFFITNGGSLPLQLKHLAFDDVAKKRPNRDFLKVDFLGVSQQPDLRLTEVREEVNAPWLVLQTRLEEATRSMMRLNLGSGVAGSGKGRDGRRSSNARKLGGVGMDSRMASMRSRKSFARTPDASRRSSRKRSHKFKSMESKGLLMLGKSSSKFNQSFKKGAPAAEIEVRMDQALDAYQSRACEVVRLHALSSESAVYEGNAKEVEACLSSAESLPLLKPGFSWHFRIAYTSANALDVRLPLIFACKPWQTEEVVGDVASGELHFTEECHRVGVLVHAKGIRRLSIEPTSFDFGNVPAMQYATEEPATLEGKVYQLKIQNSSTEVQSIEIEKVTCDSFTLGRTSVVVGPGAVEDVPIRFTPLHAQTEYLGAVHVRDQFRLTKISLRGAGACADLFASEETLLFDAVKRGHPVSKKLSLSNRGRLPSRFRIETEASWLTYKVSGLPSEEDDEEYSIVPNDEGILTLTCFVPPECEASDLEEGFDIVWERIPGGMRERLRIGVRVEVGVIRLVVEGPSTIDLGLCTLNYPSEHVLKLRNAGTAECAWSSVEEQMPSWLTMEPGEGIIPPKSAVRVSLIALMRECEPVESSLVIDSDGGSVKLGLHATVAVPTVKMPERLDFDFGVLLGQDVVRRLVKIKNTGRTSIDYELQLFHHVKTIEGQRKRLADKIVSIWNVDGEDRLTKAEAFIRDKLIKPDKKQDGGPVAAAAGELAAAGRRASAVEQLALAEATSLTKVPAAPSAEDPSRLDVACYSISPCVGCLQPGEELAVHLVADAARDGVNQVRSEARKNDEAAAFVGSWVFKSKQLPDVWEGRMRCLVGDMECTIEMPDNAIRLEPSQGAGDRVSRSDSMCYLGVCMVQQTFVKLGAFRLVNSGTIDIDFTMHMPAERGGLEGARFHLSTMEGVLAPGEGARIDVTFSCDREGFRRQLVEVTVSPTLGSSSSKVEHILLCATSGTPVLLCEAATLDFGHCQVGVKQQKQVTLQSAGNCPVTWEARLEPVGGMDDPDGAMAQAFFLDSTSGTIASQDQHVVTVSFSPTLAEGQDLSAHRARLVVDWAGQKPFVVDLLGKGARAKLSWRFADETTEQAQERQRDPRAGIDFGVQPSYLGSGMTWKHVILENLGSLPMETRVLTDLPADVFLVCQDMMEAKTKETALQIERRFENMQKNSGADQNTLELGKAFALQSAGLRSSDSSRDIARLGDSGDGGDGGDSGEGEGGAGVDAPDQHDKEYVVMRRIKLAPGDQASIIVGFLPNSRASYTSHLRIKTLRFSGETFIPVRGRGGHIKLNMRSRDQGALDMGMIGLGHNNMKLVQISNDGILESPLDVLVHPPEAATLLTVVAAPEEEPEEAGAAPGGQPMRRHLLDETHDNQRKAQVGSGAGEHGHLFDCAIAGRSSVRLSLCFHPLEQGEFSGWLIVRPTRADLPPPEHDKLRSHEVSMSQRRHSASKDTPPPERRKATLFGLAIPFKYKAVNNRLRLSRTYDFGFGRVPHGRSEVDRRKICNPTEMVIDFEIQLQWPSGVDYSNSWTVSPLHGRLEPGQEVGLSVEFHSVDLDPECWHDLDLCLVNRTTQFTDICLRAFGSHGVPELALSTAMRDINFGTCPVGSFVQVPLKIWNSGTGLLHVRPVMHYRSGRSDGDDGDGDGDESGIYVGWPALANASTLPAVPGCSPELAPHGVGIGARRPERVQLDLAVGAGPEVTDYVRSLQNRIKHGWGLGDGIAKPAVLGFGVIGPGEALDVRLVFAPRKPGELCASLQLTSNCGDKVNMELRGTADKFGLDVGQIPAHVDFGEVILGEPCSRQLQLVRAKGVEADVPVRMTFCKLPELEWAPPLGIGGILERHKVFEPDLNDSCLVFSSEHILVGEDGASGEVALRIPEHWLDRGQPTKQSAKWISKVLAEQPAAPSMRVVPAFVHAPGCPPLRFDVRYRLAAPKIMSQVLDAKRLESQRGAITISHVDEDVEPAPQVANGALHGEMRFGSVLLRTDAAMSAVLSSNTALKLPFEARIEVDKHPNSTENYSAFFHLSRKRGVVTRDSPAAVKLTCNFAKSFDSRRMPVRLRITFLHDTLPPVVVPVHVRTMHHVFNPRKLQSLVFEEPVFVGSRKSKVLELENVSDDAVDAIVTFSDSCFYTEGSGALQLGPEEVKAVPVYFRPAISHQYEAQVHVQVGSLIFSVEVSGSGCVASLKVRPETKLDFGFVGVMLGARRELTVKNTCALPLEMRIEGLPDCFRAAPREFTLKSRASRTVFVDFNPLAEKLYEGGLMVRALRPLAAGEAPTEGDDRTVTQHGLEIVGYGGRVALRLPPELNLGRVSSHIEQQVFLEVVNAGDVALDVKLTAPPGDSHGTIKLAQDTLSLLPTQSANVRVTAVITEEGEQRFPITIKPAGAVGSSNYKWGVDLLAHGDKIQMSAELQRILDNEELPLLAFRSDDVEERHLTEVLAPVVRLRSTPLGHLLALVEPVCAAHEDIADVVTRPPPLAIEPPNPLQNRWYSNRVPLRVTAQYEYTFKDPLWAKLNEGHK